MCVQLGNLMGLISQTQLKPLLFINRSSLHPIAGEEEEETFSIGQEERTEEEEEETFATEHSAAETTGQEERTGEEEETLATEPSADAERTREEISGDSNSVPSMLHICIADEEPVTLLAIVMKFPAIPRSKKKSILPEEIKLREIPTISIPIRYL